MAATSSSPGFGRSPRGSPWGPWPDPLLALALGSLALAACGPDIEGDEPGECEDGRDDDVDGM